MEHNIIIEVKDLGKAVGTLGWLNARLATSSVDIEPDKNGRLCAYWTYVHPITHEPKKRKVAEICCTQKQLLEAEEFKEYGYQLFDGEVAYAFASDGEWANAGESRWSVFGVRLTDAAAAKVSDTMKTIVQNLKLAYNGEEV